MEKLLVKMEKIEKIENYRDFGKKYSMGTDEFMEACIIVLQVWSCLVWFHANRKCLPLLQLYVQETQPDLRI